MAGRLGQEHLAPAGFWVVDCGRTARLLIGGEGNAYIPAPLFAAAPREGECTLRQAALLLRCAVADDDERDGWVAAREGAQKQAIVLRFAAWAVVTRVGIEEPAFEVPIGFEEEFATQTNAAFDGEAEAPAGALAEEEVFGAEVEEDGFEELGDIEDA